MNGFTKIIVIIILVFVGCEESEYPDNIYDPNASMDPDPIITAILPQDSAFSGADIITIQGENFSSNVKEVLVFFDGVSADILSSTETAITVSPPAILGDSITIKIAIIGAMNFGIYDNYKLYPRIETYGEFLQFDESLWGLAVDSLENVYVGLDIFPEGSIEKLEPPKGNRINDFIHAVLPKPLTMRIGPDNQIYYIDGANPYIVRQNLSTGAPGFNVLPGVPYAMDFDDNDHLYCGGGGNEIYLINLDLSVSVVADYTDIIIRAVRVFDGYVYVGGNYIGADTTMPVWGIWRNRILAEDGSLEEKELVYDWAMLSPSSSIADITFDENGLLYVATDNSDGLMVIDDTGSVAPVYPKIIDGPIAKMSWGNDRYLYLNYRGESRALYRIYMGIKGSPYYGR